MLQASFTFGADSRHTMEIRLGWWGREEYRLDGILVQRFWSPLSSVSTREFVVGSHTVRVELCCGLKNYFARAFVDGKLVVDELFPKLAAMHQERRAAKGGSPWVTGMAWSGITTIVGATTPLASGRFMFFMVVAIVAGIFAFGPLVRKQRRIGIAGAIVCIPALVIALANFSDAMAEAGRYGKSGDSKPAARP